MNKTLATLLGIPQKPAATVVVFNGAPGAATEETTAPAPTTEAAPTEETTTETAPTAEAAPTEETATETAPTTEAAPTAEASVATAQEGAMVSISQAQLTTLQAAATELAEMKPKYEILNTWYNNVKGEGVTPGQDPTGTTEKKSWEKAPWNQ